MDNTENSGNKTFVSTDAIVNNDHPIKKCHFLDGKYFIVIDHSIVEKLTLSGIDEIELYFQQELTKNGSIILHPFRIGK